MKDLSDLSSNNYYHICPGDVGHMYGIVLTFAVNPLLNKVPGHYRYCPKCSGITGSAQLLDVPMTYILFKI